MNQKITPKDAVVRLHEDRLFDRLARPGAPTHRARLEQFLRTPRRLVAIVVHERADVVVHFFLQVTRTERKQQHHDGEREFQQAKQSGPQPVRDRRDRHRRDQQQGNSRQQGHRTGTTTECPVGAVEQRVEPAQLAQAEQLRQASLAESANNSASRLMRGRPRVRSAPAP
jgi:hypothetical protein